MARARPYSPQLDGDLIPVLYRAAKARRIPMTRLASALVREGLGRLTENQGSGSAVVREEPPVPDPHRRTD